MWQRIYNLLKRTATSWLNNNDLRFGAALAFYATLSLAPLLVIITSIFGLFYGEKAAQSELLGQMETIAGPQQTKFIKNVLANVSDTESGIIASILGLIGLFTGATAVLVELHSALNIIWNVTAQRYGTIVQIIVSRLKSFALILSVGFILLTSLVLSSAINAAGNYIGSGVSSDIPVIAVANTIISFVVIMFLFAAIFRILPDKHIPWRDVWAGALFSALLFTFGKSLLSRYIGYTASTSVYGAAGSLFLFLIWVYYASQVLFLGAEFTRAYSLEFGSFQAEKDQVDKIQSEKTRVEKAVVTPVDEYIKGGESSGETC